MGRVRRRRDWEDCYHGEAVADAIKDLGFVRPDGKPLVSQPHLRFDDKDMWTLDHVRGHTLQSPLRLLREMSPKDREKSLAEYRKGFKIRPFNCREQSWEPLRRGSQDYKRAKHNPHQELNKS